MQVDEAISRNLRMIDRSKNQMLAIPSERSKFSESAIDTKQSQNLFALKKTRILNIIQ